jgi:hypothetical protein
VPVGIACAFCLIPVGFWNLLIDARRWHFERSQLPLQLPSPDGGIVRKPPEWS